MAGLLIVDDERVVREQMKALFTGEGYEVRTARDGDEAIAKFAERRPDLVLLDVMMPKANGFLACGELRRLDRTVPVVFLTAMDSDANEVRALGLGADDFVSKADDSSVLLARVRRALERVAERDASEADESVRIGDRTFDVRRRTLTAPDGTAVALTRTESDILALLASDRNRAFSSDEIIVRLRGEGFACADNMIYAHIHNLRAKMGAAGNLLISDRKAGYRLMS